MQWIGKFYSKHETNLWRTTGKWKNEKREKCEIKSRLSLLFCTRCQLGRKSEKNEWLTTWKTYSTGLSLYGFVILWYYIQLKTQGNELPQIVYYSWYVFWNFIIPFCFLLGENFKFLAFSMKNWIKMCMSRWVVFFVTFEKYYWN